MTDNVGCGALCHELCDVPLKYVLSLSHLTDKEIVASERLSTLIYVTQLVLDQVRHNLLCRVLEVSYFPSVHTVVSLASLVLLSVAHPTS